MNSAEPNVVFTQTKLFMAVTSLTATSYETVAELVKAGEDVNLRGEYDETYLHILSAPAFKYVHPYVIPVIFHLVDAGLDINSKDHEGNTPLHVCAVNDAHHTIASALIKAGADPCLLNSDEQDALDLCADRRVRKVLTHFDLGIWRLIHDGSVEKVHRMINSWCRIDTKQDGKTLLQWAEECGNNDILASLKASKNTISLIHACLANKLSIVKELLKKDDVNVDVQDASFLRDEDGANIVWPLMAEVVRLGHWQCVKPLAKKADLNVEIEPIRGQRQPLFLWILAQVDDLDPPLIRALVKNADLSLVRNPVDLSYRCWLRECPDDLMSLLVKRGLSLSGRDTEGYTLRDLIFVEMQQRQASRQELREALWWVDQHVLQLAKDGDIKRLEAMALAGYDYINVFDLKGKSSVRHAKKEKQTETVAFLKKLPQLQENCQTLHRHIENGNLLGARDLLDEKMVMATDRAGRSALHKAVLYERRFVISHLLRDFPEAVKCRDVMLRTPLHYACAMQGGQDVQEWLLEAGANQDSRDIEGRSPRSYLERADFLAQERDRAYGGDVYILERHATFGEAIEQDKKERVIELSEALGGSMTLDELETRAACRLPEEMYRPLLFQCVDHGNQQLAIQLIKEGASYTVAAKMVKDNGVEEEMTLEDAAELKEMFLLLDLIRRRKNNDQEDLQAQLAVESAIASMDDTDRSDISTRLSHYKVNSCETDSNDGSNDGSQLQQQQQQRRQGNNDSKSPQPPPAKRRHSGPDSEPPAPSNNGQQNSAACVIL